MCSIGWWRWCGPWVALITRINPIFKFRVFLHIVGIIKLGISNLICRLIIVTIAHVSGSRDLLVNFFLKVTYIMSRKRYKREVYKCKTDRKSYVAHRMVPMPVTLSDSVNQVITWKRCKVETCWLQTTNRKWYMPYRIVPFPMTLSDLQGHSSIAGLFKRDFS